MNHSYFRSLGFNVIINELHFIICFAINRQDQTASKKCFIFFVYLEKSVYIAVIQKKSALCLNLLYYETLLPLYEESVYTACFPVPLRIGSSASVEVQGIL